MKIPERLQSKKFLAFFYSQTLIGALIAYGIYKPPVDLYTIVFLVSGMLSVASLAVGYILSQKALDKFLKGIAGIADASNNRNGVG